MRHGAQVFEQRMRDVGERSGKRIHAQKRDGTHPASHHCSAPEIRIAGRKRSLPALTNHYVRHR